MLERRDGAGARRVGDGRKDAALSEVTNEDIERLANRMAMLVSDNGEADNAGRAVGQLARRLGLSGGDLKQMVIVGAGDGFRPGSMPGQERLEREVAALTRALHAAEAAARAARQDRDTLMAENGAMRVSIYRHRAAAKLRRLLMGLGVLGVGLVGAAVVWLGPDITGRDIMGRRAIDPAPRDTARASPSARTASVRKAGATLYVAADRTSPVLGRLPAGMVLRVTRTDWHMMMLWALVEVDGRPGYVLSTELDM